VRGFFAIGIEGASKAVNLGNLLRSAHAFGASFAFTIGADPRVMDTMADTSRASSHLPLYHWQSVDELRLPRGCRLVGIELLDEAVELPAFPHPLQAAYVVGPERACLAPAWSPTAIILSAFRPLSRSMSPPPAPSSCTIGCAASAGFASRPVAAGGLPEPVAEHVQGGPRRRKRRV
jgi:hypothetical protein